MSILTAPNAVEALSALAHGARLDVFRLLVRAGEEGLPAGEIARRLDTPANTMSTSLAILQRSNLIRSRRDGRSVIYSADYGAFSELLSFLVEDCCDGRPEVCSRLANVVGSALSCAADAGHLGEKQ